MKKLYFLLSFLLITTALRAQQCFDYTDLAAATCYTTSFNDQGYLLSWNQRLVDNGPANMTSRHTVHTDTLEWDARTGYQLRTTLPNGKPAVRLGNWDINKQAERIVYTFTVPDDNSVLILYYAVVLEDPGHEASEQPRFTLELLKNGVPVASDCFAFDFKSGYDMDSLSWHMEMPGICWKDWTMMGVSLNEFAGQTVQLQFTTYDCSKGEHYGYAYFGLECHSQKMETTSCGDYTEDDAATFIAPSGFNYRWYLPTQSEDTLSKEQIFYHTGPVKTYYCDIINKENDQCFFTLEATPEARYPIAEFAIEQHKNGCADTLILTNLSGVSEDGITKNDPLESCDNYLWDFGDGRTSDEKEPLLVYSTPGTYTITLIAGLNNWQCASSEFTTTVTVSARETAKSREVTLCEGNTFTWHGQTYTHEGEYTDPLGEGLCDSVLVLHVNPIGKSVVYDTICHGDSYSWRGATLTESGVYTDTAYNKTDNGCDSVYYLNLAYYTRYDRVPQELQDRLGPASVHTRRNVSYYSSSAEPWDDPYMLVHIDHVQEDAMSYDWHGKTYTQSGVYMDTLSTVLHGCDSIVFLDLELTAVPTMTIIPETDSLCEGGSYEWQGRGSRFADLTQAGEYRDTIIDPITLDTTLYILTLTELLRTYGDTVAYCCPAELPFSWHGKVLNEAGSEKDTILNAAGCDSIITLTLILKQNTSEEINLTLCEAQLPYLWNGISCTTEGDYPYHTDNATGCDSTVTLHLSVNTYSASDTVATICAAQLPYLWHGKVLNAAGTEKDTAVSSVGCDSIITLTLRVNQPSTAAVEVTVCDTLLPYTWNGNDYTATGDYTYTTTNAVGCDSVVTLHLIVETCLPPEPPEPTCEGKTTYGEEYVTVCDTLLPYIWKGKDYTATGNYTYTTTNAVDCDSVVTLHLIVETCLPPTPPEPTCIGLDAVVTMDTLCADDRYLPLHIDITKGKAITYSLTFDEAAQQQGFESVPTSAFHRNLTIPVPFPADSTRYVRPDRYSMTLSLTDTCGMVNNFTLPFTVLYPKWLIMQKWNDVLAIKNERYNGGYTFSSIRWFCQGQELNGRGEHHSYIYTQPELLRFGEPYYALLTRTGENYAIRTCYFYPERKDVPDMPKLANRVQLRARSEHRHSWWMNATTNGSFTVYDVQGHLLQQGTFSADSESENELLLNYSGGVYIILFRFDDGEQQVNKMLID